MHPKFWLKKPEGKRSHGRSRHGSEDHNRIDLKETGWGVMDWMPLAQDSNQW
jgi:hypothetical protein